MPIVYVSSPSEIVLHNVTDEELSILISSQGNELRQAAWNAGWVTLTSFAQLIASTREFEIGSGTWAIDDSASLIIFVSSISIAIATAYFGSHKKDEAQELAAQIRKRVRHPQNS